MEKRRAWSAASHDKKRNDPAFRRAAILRAKRHYAQNRDKCRVYHRTRYALSVYGEVLSDPMEYSKDRYRVARTLGFRSGLEVKIAKQIEEAGVPVLYEAFKIRYVWPQQDCTYTPDYILPNGVVVETKGRFLTEDRQKSKHVKAQYPELDLRFVFSNANARLTKVSKTTYAAWSEKYGFNWANKIIPASWFAEAPCIKRLRALHAATRGLFRHPLLESTKS